AARGVPKKIVPFNWQRDIFKICGMMGILVLAVYLLPQFDPFHLQQQQRKLAEQRNDVRKLDKATQARAALLEQKRAGEQTDVVKQAIANLEKTFQEAKPNDKAGTLNRLNEQQKILGQLW